MIDTAIITGQTHNDSRPAVDLRRNQARHNQARYLVAEYLHDWGLRDPEVIADESRRVVEEAEQRLQESSGTGSDLTAVAIELIQTEVEASIARMAVPLDPSPRKRIATNNSIVPRMGRVLLEFPDAIRHRDRPPARLLQVLEKSVNPIVPCAHRCEMVPQPRTRLWKVLRRGYWFRMRRRVVSMARQYAGITGNDR